MYVNILLITLSKVSMVHSAPLSLPLRDKKFVFIIGSFINWNDPERQHPSGQVQGRAK
jgi:hypothetical protein